jgi:hypothetical protein
MESFPRTHLPFEVSSLELPGPLISKAQSGRVNIRSTQQIGRTWSERFLLNTRNVTDRGLLATVNKFWRNGTIFTITHMDHLTPLGALGGSPLVNASPQLVTDPENFGAWTATTTTRTSGQTDPLGGTAAYLLTPTGGASSLILEAVTFTADATKAAACYLKAGTATQSGLEISKVGTIRHRAKATWTAGVPALTDDGGSGALYAVADEGNGWYRIMMSAAGVVAADANRIVIYPDLTGSNGTVYAFGVNSWNSTTPSAYVGPSNPISPTGNALYVDGATASVSNWLRAGDILSVAGVKSIYEASADVSSEVNGYARIPITPSMFAGGGQTDNAAVTLTGVTLQAVILEPPTFPTTSGTSMDYGELHCRFSESL